MTAQFLNRALYTALGAAMGIGGFVGIMYLRRLLILTHACGIN